MSGHWTFSMEVPLKCPANEAFSHHSRKNARTSSSYSMGWNNQEDELQMAAKTALIIGF